MMHMSPMLRGDMANRENAGWVLAVPMFANGPILERYDLITEVSMAMEPYVFVPGDEIIVRNQLPKEMFVVDKGMAILNVPGRMPQFQSMGAVFGEDVILAIVTDTPQQRSYKVTAVTYVDTHQLSSGTLRQLLTTGQFPETFRHIRRVALKLFLKTTFPIMLRKNIENPAVKNFKDLARQVTGGTKDVEIAIQQHVDAEEVAPQGFTSEQLNQVTALFDKAGKSYKSLFDDAKDILANMQSARREQQDWQKRWAAQAKPVAEKTVATKDDNPNIIAPGVVRFDGSARSLLVPHGTMVMMDMDSIPANLRVILPQAPSQQQAPSDDGTLPVQ